MVHEGPSLSALSREKVGQGMVFTVEPGVYIPGWGGVRIEDMVYITENGAKVLTTLPKELESLKSLVASQESRALNETSISERRKGGYKHCRYQQRNSETD